MSSHTSSNISSRKTISSNLENSMRSLSTVVNSISDSDPAIEQMNKEIGDYEGIIDSDTFYKENSNNTSEPVSSVTENFNDTTSTCSKWFVIILVLIFIAIAICRRPWPRCELVRDFSREFVRDSLVISL